MGIIDLHMHSCYSDDGEYTPEDLVDMCLERKLRYISIADHNCTSGIGSAMVYCKGRNIELIPAVELDCTFEGCNLHVLGYGVDYNSAIFKELHDDILLQEREASKTRKSLVRQLGIGFSEQLADSLSKNGVVTGEMLAEAAMKYDSNHENQLLKPYYEGGSRSSDPYVNFYWDYCAQGKPAYAEVRFISLQEAVTIITETGGVPVLAHPGNNVGEHEEKLEAIVSCGIKGVEAYSSYHSHTQAAWYVRFAAEHKLFVTCGSDFHGRTKPSITVGCMDCGEEAAVIAALKGFLQEEGHH